MTFIKNNLIKLSSIFLSLVILIFITFNSYSDNLNDGLKNNLLRLHVIANSDSPIDQEVKRNVRDAILEFMKNNLEDGSNLAQTINFVTSNKTAIEEISQKVISKYEKNYSVTASLGNYDFPTKTYGDIALPAGEYQALRVVIGEGQGYNWWCVLFPPLCFVDATHGTVSDSVKSELKNVLTEEEYNLITTADNDDDIPIKVKFKVVEVFQNSKIKFTGMISKVFANNE